MSNLGLPSGVRSSVNFNFFWRFSDLATISAVCAARTYGLERMTSKEIFNATIAFAIWSSRRLPLGVSGRAASRVKSGTLGSTAIPWRNK